MFTPTKRRLAVVANIAILVSSAFAVLSNDVQAATKAATKTAKSGGKCTTEGATSSGLTCAKKAGKLVWAKSAAATTKAPAATDPKPAVTVAAAGGSENASIAGTWKATDKSVVGYRVKEVLNGQSIVGAGRTNAVTGSLTIDGTKATAVDLSVDVTKLKSDQDKRDAQVQTRILETAKYPTASLKLKGPIDFGKEPKDKEEISTKATVALTLHGTTKDIAIDLKARRNGSAVEVNGSIPIVFADYAIADPSFAPFVTTEDNGILEFLVVFTK